MSSNWEGLRLKSMMRHCEIWKTNKKMNIHRKKSNKITFKKNKILCIKYKNWVHIFLCRKIKMIMIIIKFHWMFVWIKKIKLWVHIFYIFCICNKHCGLRDLVLDHRSPPPPPSRWCCSPSAAAGCRGLSAVCGREGTRRREWRRTWWSSASRRNLRIHSFKSSRSLFKPSVSRSRESARPACRSLASSRSECLRASSS